MRPWIVVPCYNEADRLDSSAFEGVLAGDGPMIVFVDDGSTDRTLELLNRIAAALPSSCEIVVAPENRGKAEAVRLGMRTALERGAPCVGYWDADLATPFSQLPALMTVLDARESTEVVLGSRVKLLGRVIERSSARHYVGRVYATLASIVLGLPVYDTQCGAKLFRRSTALETALDRPFGSRWAFDVELLQRLQLAWGDRGIDRIVEVPLAEWRDVGDSKVSLRAGAAAFLFLLGRLRHGSRSLPVRARAQSDPATIERYQST